MTIHVSAAETALRHQISGAANRIRSALTRCPAADELTFLDLDRARLAVTEATDALREAEALTETLGSLREASQEAVVLVATSRVALGVVDEVLATLTAATDALDSAAA